MTSPNRETPAFETSVYRSLVTERTKFANRELNEFPLSFSRKIKSSALSLQNKIAIASDGNSQFESQSWIRRCSWTISAAICLNHFVLIEVCPVDILVALLGIRAGFEKGVLQRDASTRALWSDKQTGLILAWLKGVFAKGCFRHVFPSRSVNGSHGLKVAKQIPPQVLLTRLLLPNEKQFKIQKAPFNENIL